MLTISSIIYLLILIAGFFIEINNIILILSMGFYLISSFTNKETSEGLYTDYKALIVSVLITIAGIFLLSILQNKMNISSYSFVNNNNKISYLYLLMTLRVVYYLFRYRTKSAIKH